MSHINWLFAAFALFSGIYSLLSLVLPDKQY